MLIMATMVDFKGLHKNVIRVNEARQRVSNVIQQNAWNGNQSCDIQKAMSIVGATAYEQGRIRQELADAGFTLNGTMVNLTD